MDIYSQITHKLLMMGDMETKSKSCIDIECLNEKILGWVKANGMNANKKTTYLDVWMWLLEEKRIYIHVGADCDDWYYNEFEVSIFVHKKTYKDSIVEPTALDHVYSSPLEAIIAAVNWLCDSAYDVNYHLDS